VPTSPSLQSRAAAALRRRLVLAALVVVSLALISVYFRESSGGSLHTIQSGAASLLRPFEVAAERVARPFRDAAGWIGGLADARSKNKRLQHEVEQYRQEQIQYQALQRENAQLQKLLAYRRSPRFPIDYRGIGVDVIAQPPGDFQQQIVLNAGSNDGIRLHDPVVTGDGLVGQVTKVARTVCQVTLLTDESSAASARDARTAAAGIVLHGASSSSLILDQVPKEDVVNRGDTIVTAGWRSGNLASIYPRGIPIGRVTSVSQLDTDLYKRIEIQPFVDFGSLESVLVLVPKTRTG
jgi:rod shape-determining protein MreC